MEKMSSQGEKLDNSMVSGIVSLGYFE